MSKEDGPSPPHQGDPEAHHLQAQVERATITGFQPNPEGEEDDDT